MNEDYENDRKVAVNILQSLVDSTFADELSNYEHAVQEHLNLDDNTMRRLFDFSVLVSLATSIPLQKRFYQGKLVVPLTKPILTRQVAMSPMSPMSPRRKRQCPLSFENCLIPFPDLDSPSEKKEVTAVAAVVEPSVPVVVEPSVTVVEPPTDEVSTPKTVVREEDENEEALPREEPEAEPEAEAEAEAEPEAEPEAELEVEPEAELEVEPEVEQEAEEEKEAPKAPEDENNGATAALVSLLADQNVDTSVLVFNGSEYKKAILVTGETKRYRQKMALLGGKWNVEMKAWVFSKKRLLKRIRQRDETSSQTSQADETEENEE